MVPTDSTPFTGEVMHTPSGPDFPQPHPGQESDEPVRGDPGRDEPQVDPEIGERPTLPEQPQMMAADVEDEEADPVVDTGPGIADSGVVSTGLSQG